MSVTTPSSDVRWFGRSHAVALIVAVLVAIGVGAWAVGTNLDTATTRSGQGSRATQAFDLRTLTPQARAYVHGLMSLSPAELKAAYGTGR
jgi:hypothetical protein